MIEIHPLAIRTRNQGARSRRKTRIPLSRYPFLHAVMEQLEPRIVFTCPVGTASADEYEVVTILDMNSGNCDYQLNKNGYQFASFAQTPAGTVGFRGKPDFFELNGWGATQEVNVFTVGPSGEGPGPIAGTIDGAVPTPTGIQLTSSGNVSSPSGYVGTWNWNSFVTYNLGEQRVDLDGMVSVSLTSSLANDMNVTKTKSNFLHNHSLNTGRVGDTGDMSKVTFDFGPDPPARVVNYHDEWIPSPVNQGHFPTDKSADVTVTVVGAVNLSDPNEVAIRKPTVKTTLFSTDETTRANAGAQWDSDTAMFFNDNVGAGHIVRPFNTTSTEFEFLMTSTWTPPDTPAVSLGVQRGDLFYLDINGNGVWNNFAGGDAVYRFGNPGDVPIVGDWDGDGNDNIGFHRGNQFYLDVNGNGKWDNFAGGDVRVQVR